MINLVRTKAIFRKELRDFRRNRFVVATMCVMPILFLAIPAIEIFAIPATGARASIDTRVGVAMLYLLLNPAILPAVISAYSVVGEREQGTLEPVLTTPVRAQEFLLGKAAAALIPTLAISYAMFGIFLLLAQLIANPLVTSAIFRGPIVLAQLIFIPLLAGWSIWVCLMISTRANDVRVAQQLGTLASLPPLAVESLIGFNVLHPTFALAAELGGGLLLIDLATLRLVSAMFNRERLVTGRKDTTRRARAIRRRAATPAATALAAATGRANTQTEPAEARRRMTTARTATLKVTRRWGGLMERSRTWDLEVDGQIVGSVPPEETVEVPVQPGRHTVRLHRDRHLSPIRTFEVADGELASFWCRSTMFWPRYIASTFKNDLWIIFQPD